MQSKLAEMLHLDLEPVGVYLGNAEAECDTASYAPRPSASASIKCDNKRARTFTARALSSLGATLGS